MAPARRTCAPNVHRSAPAGRPDRQLRVSLTRHDDWLTPVIARWVRQMHADLHVASTRLEASSRRYSSRARYRNDPRCGDPIASSSGRRSCPTAPRCGPAGPHAPKRTRCAQRRPTLRIYAHLKRQPAIAWFAESIRVPKFQADDHVTTLVVRSRRDATTHRLLDLTTLAQLEGVRAAPRGQSTTRPGLPNTEPASRGGQPAGARGGALRSTA
jgi:hypothetical protein